MSSTKFSHSSRPGIWSVVEHAGLSALMAFIMLLVYLGGFHKPAAHDLELAVVSEDPVVSVHLQNLLTDSLGDGAHVRALASQDEARDLLKDRSISAAYVPGENSGTLMLASAASETTASAVTKIFQKVTQQQGIALAIEDVVPLEENDPSGQNAFFYLVALSVGSYATSIAIAAAGSHLRMILRVTIATGASLTIATVFLLTSHWVYGLFEGHLRAAWALSLLYSFAVLCIGVGLRPLLKHYSTLVYASLFVGLNFTSSGGVFGPELQGTFFQILHHFWIGAGFIEAIKNISYFPTVSIANSLTVLFAWLIVGLCCLMIGAFYENRRNKSLYFSSPRREKMSMSLKGHLPEEIEEELEENVAPA